ncbi:MAG: PIG-L family deacetylase [Clostridia bacterium]|nr:PIG-L family deacetylase [Clostridia bacterium]
MKKTLGILILLAALLMASPALAAKKQAVDLARQCQISTSGNGYGLGRMLEEDITRYWDSGSDATLTVILPEGKKAQGIMIGFYGNVPALRVVAAGGKVLADWEMPFENAWIPFSEPAERFLIQRKTEGDEMLINRLHVLSQGELPDWVQDWKIMDGPADLMLIATHPDDDILWFGGLLPTYAGELQRKVQVVYMVGGLNRKRKNELLNALWHCGVTYYPQIGSLPDMGGKSVASTLSAWGGENAAPTYIVGMLRKWKPRVVITQDIKGEYGHNHHIVTVQAVIDAVERLSADITFAPESAAQYGVYSPQKLYIHLYPENEIVFDWQQPLRHFGGKTGLELAKEAFKMHVSQQNGRHSVKDSGAYDCRRFGLYYSAVGPDEQHNDLFEHVLDTP